MRYFFLFISIVLVAGRMVAQEPKLTEASALHWAGGVCCSSGINYCFSYDVTEKNTLKIDTVWIGKQLFVPDGVQTVVTEKKGRTTIRISYAVKNVAYQGEMYKEEQTPATSVKTIKPPKYKGEAMLITTYNGKRKTILVKKISHAYEANRP